MELGNAEAIKRMVEAGLGVGLTSAITVRAEAADGRLAVRRLAPPLTRGLDRAMARQAREPRARGAPRRAGCLASRAARALAPAARGRLSGGRGDAAASRSVARRHPADYPRTMTSSPRSAEIGQPAPVFALPSLDGAVVDLARYRGRHTVIVWFSRGFTCPYCLDYMSGVAAGYDAVRAADTEVIQVAPNLLDSARRFFGGSAAPYPFVCDPDKRLYAVYGLGDRGALEAGRAAVVSLSHAVAQGAGRLVGARRVARHRLAQLRAAPAPPRDDRARAEPVLRRRQGVIRHRITAGPIEPIPSGAALAALARTHCDGASAPA